MAGIGDLDGDGLDDVLTLDAAVVEVLSGPTGAPLLSIPVAFDPTTVLQYAALAGPGDIDCDGVPDILVAGQTDDTVPTQGVARLYSGSDGALLWEAFGLGQDVDGMDDVNGDGVLDWLVTDADVARIYSGAGLQPITIYCSAKTNSQGCVPAIDAAGTAGASIAAPFPITVRQVVNQKPGLLFYGTVGPTNLPFFGGTLCVLPPLQRTPISTSGGNPPPDDCSGAYLFDFNAWFQGGNDPSLVPLEEVRAQFWMRDPQSVDGTGVGLSDAVAFPLCP